MIKDPPSRQRKDSVHELITQKWKVAYEDLSLETRSCGLGEHLRKASVYALSGGGLVDAGGVNNNSTYGHSGESVPPKKSQSVPPPSSRPIDCLECPGMGTPLATPCACPRKRKEPQDTLHEHERKFSRSYSLHLERDDVRVALTLPAFKEATLEPLGESSCPVEEAKEAGMEEAEREATAEQKKARRRRKRHRSSQENKGRREQSGGHWEHSGRHGGKEQVDNEEEPELMVVEVEERRNPLGFLMNGPQAVLRPYSPMADENSSGRSSSCSEPEVSSLEKPAQADGCWVSQHLAHIMAVDGPKEIMRLESPQVEAVTGHLVDYGRFTEMNNNNSSSRSSKAENPKLRQLTRQLSALRRRIESLEAEFTAEYGYRPSHQDKLNIAALKPLIVEQNQLKQELKEEKGDKGGEETPRKVSLEPRSRSSVERRRQEILEQLEQSREQQNRPEDYQQMNTEQIFQEKLVMHTLLRDYEKEFGHPETKEEKEVMKDVYERYRIIKRMSRRSSQGRSGDIIGDLVTIPEEGEVDLTLLTPAPRIHLELSHAHYTSCSAQQPVSRHDMDLPAFKDREEGGASPLWHAMTRDQLLAALSKVREEKKVARRAVKEFEERFRHLTGRSVSKEDREPLERTYRLYKSSKAKLKLITALLDKGEGRPHRRDRYNR